MNNSFDLKSAVDVRAVLSTMNDIRTKVLVSKIPLDKYVEESKELATANEISYKMLDEIVNNNNVNMVLNLPKSGDELNRIHSVVTYVFERWRADHIEECNRIIKFLETFK